MSTLRWTRLWRWFVPLAAIAVACTGSDVEPVTPPTSKCVEGETCGLGLSCVANQCVAVSDAAAPQETSVARRPVIGVWARGLLAYWPFDGDARDYSGNDFDLDANNVTYEPGVKDRAVRRDTTSIIQRSGRDDLLNLAIGSFTVQLWAKIDDEASAVLLNKTDGVSHNGWRAVRQPSYNDAGFAFIFLSYTDAGIGSGISASAPAPKSWAHLVFVRTEANGEVAVYVNGELVNHGPVAAIATSEALMRIGESVEQPEHRFAGLLDEIAIWNRALTPVEVKDLYNGGLGLSLLAP